MKLDENNKRDVANSASSLLSAENTKKKIKVIWGLNDDILSGLFVYLDVLDDYFNPRLNDKDLFFEKIYTYNKDLLEKIGKKIVKPAFPFQSFENYKKKVVLIR